MCKFRVEGEEIFFDFCTSVSHMNYVGIKFTCYKHELQYVYMVEGEPPRVETPNFSHVFICGNGTLGSSSLSNIFLGIPDGKFFLHFNFGEFTKLALGRVSQRIYMNLVRLMIT